MGDEGAAVYNCLLCDSYALLILGISSSISTLIGSSVSSSSFDDSAADNDAVDAAAFLLFFFFFFFFFVSPIVDDTKGDASDANILLFM